MALSAPRKLALSALFGLFAPACFIEPTAPAAFRADCSAEGDCLDGESCIAGLCQIPCSLSTFATDCPQDGTYFACFNGVCASSCSSDGETDSCPGAQSCIEFDLSGLGGDGDGDSEADSGFGASAGDPSFSVCGQPCDDPGAPPCPGEEVCLQGFCIDLGGDDTGDSGTDGETTESTGGY